MTGLEVAPIRPRAASVIAVIWLYLSVSWILTGAAMLLMVAILASLAPGHGQWLGVLPIFFGGFALAGGLGLRGALELLKLRSRGRSLLEWANWLSFIGVLLFTLHFCSVFGSVPNYFGGSSFDPSRAVLPLLMGVAFSLPFAFMARSLRSDEVRFAVRDAEVRQIAG